MDHDYVLLDHTADLAVQIEGHSLKSLFEKAGMALIHLLVRGDAPSEPVPTEVSVSGQDLADLLVRWLGEIHYLFAGEDRVVTSITLGYIGPERVEAIVQTVPFDPGVHWIHTEVKGVTYHKAEVIEQGSGHWTATFVLDV